MDCFKYLTVAMLEATMVQLERIAPDLFTRVELSEPSLDNKKIHADPDGPRQRAQPARLPHGRWRPRT